MKGTQEVKVPDIGDFKDVPIIEIMVKPGDTVKAEDPLIKLESDKAIMDVPSSGAGTIKELKVQIGDKVSEGSLVLLLEPATMKFERTYLACCFPGHLLHILGFVVCVFLLFATLYQGGSLRDGWSGQTVVTTWGMIVALAFLSFGFLTKLRLFRSAVGTRSDLLKAWTLNLIYLAGWALFWVFGARSRDTTYDTFVASALGLLVFLAGVSIVRMLHVRKAA
jgi:hypothetical protein